MPPDQTGLTLDAPPGAAGADDQPPSAPPLVRDPRPVEPPPQSKRQKRLARRVRRVVRRVDPWSVLKVSLVFYICGYIVTMVAGILLWNLGGGVIDKIESFIMDYGSFEVFEFNADVILRSSLLIGAIVVVVATGLTVLASILFNLISDLVGGVRLTILEEEPARPARPEADAVPGPGAASRA